MDINWKSKYYLYNLLENFQVENNIKHGCNVFKLCKLKGWHLIPYPIENEKILCGISEDGFTKYYNNQFYIFYNPKKPHKRINFTVAHEIGHIVLYHHFLIGNEVLMYSENEKAVWEIQADLFAQNLLMPAKITNKLINKYDIDTFSEIFDVSKPMVITRLNKLYQDNLYLRKYDLRG